MSSPEVPTNALMFVAAFATWPWLSSTPFLRPVVPVVNRRSAGLSAEQRGVRVASDAAHCSGGGSGRAAEAGAWPGLSASTSDGAQSSSNCWTLSTETSEPIGTAMPPAA